MSQDFDCFSAEDFKEGLGPLGKLDDTMMRYISLLDNAPNWFVGCIIQKKHKNRNMK